MVAVYLHNFLEEGFRFYVHSHHALPYLSSGGLSLSQGTRLYAAITPLHVPPSPSPSTLRVPSAPFRQFIFLPKDEWGRCKINWEPSEMDTFKLLDEENNTIPYTAATCEAPLPSPCLPGSK